MVVAIILASAKALTSIDTKDDRRKKSRFIKRNIMKTGKLQKMRKISE